MLHVTTTCPDLDVARDIARAALRDRLAACATLRPGLVSLFHWRGKIDESPEVGLEFKTTPAHLPALVALIDARHPYDLPVVTWHEVGSTDQAELWLTEETGG